MTYPLWSGPTTGRRAMFRRAAALLVVFAGVSAGAGGVGGASARPDSSWSAAGLLTSAKVAAALGEPVVGIEDDGGVPASNGITGEISAARVMTGSGIVLDVTLYSLGSAKDAKSLYSQLAGQVGSGDSIAGAGDRSAYANGQSVVLKGAQVLSVREDEGPALRQQLDTIKLNGGDPREVAAAYALAAQKVAAPLGAALKGTAAAKPAVVLAPGAIDLCPITAATSASSSGSASVSITADVSERPPGMQCSWTYGGLLHFTVTIVTNHQLASALPPTPKDVHALFAQDQGSGAGAGTGTGASAPAAGTGGSPELFFKTAPEVTVEYVSGQCLVRVSAPGSPPTLTRAQYLAAKKEIRKEQDKLYWERQLQRLTQAEKGFAANTQCAHDDNVSNDKRMKELLGQTGDPLAEALLNLAGAIPRGLGLAK